MQKLPLSFCGGVDRNQWVFVRGVRSICEALSFYSNINAREKQRLEEEFGKGRYGENRS